MYFRFPTDEVFRKKWYDFVTKNNLLTSDVTKYTIICSNHFNPDVFINYKNTRLLKKTAAPTIIICRAKYVGALFF